ncbi:MAG: hypothetical protein H7039_06325 [Bryobacteraceae bacterium]|nr:hypothetical protein [Bryobacteraceae bacterium]
MQNPTVPPEDLAKAQQAVDALLTSLSELLERDLTGSNSALQFAAGDVAE